MGCLAVLLALISPRLAIVAIWLFSDILGRAYDEWWLPLVGFFLLPWTTFTYALMWAAGTNRVEGYETFLVILAFLFDLGAYFGSSKGGLRR